MGIKLANGVDDIKNDNEEQYETSKYATNKKNPQQVIDRKSIGKVVKKNKPSKRHALSGRG